MRIPTIHLNGSPIQHIYDGLGEAAYRLTEAIEAVQKAGPNARDYYVQGPEAFRQAADEHIARLAKLQAVASELEAIFSGVCAQDQ